MNWYTQGMLARAIGFPLAFMVFTAFEMISPLRDWYVARDIRRHKRPM